MGGDCIGTDLTPISTGQDFIRMVIDVACGNAPDFTIVTKPSYVRVKFIMNQEDLAEMRKVELASPERIVRIAEIDENFDREVVDSSTRHGYYIIKEKV